MLCAGQTLEPGFIASEGQGEFRVIEIIFAQGEFILVLCSLHIHQNASGGDVVEYFAAVFMMT